MSRGPPIGAAPARGTYAHREGQRTRLSRRGRHRGIFWAPPCPTCHRGGFRATHTNEDKNYFALPCYPVKSDWQAILSTAPVMTSLPLAEPLPKEIVSETRRSLPPITTGISTREVPSVLDTNKLGDFEGDLGNADILAHNIMDCVRFNGDDIVHITQSFIKLHAALSELPEEDLQPSYAQTYSSSAGTSDTIGLETIGAPQSNGYAVILGPVALLHDAIQRMYYSLATSGFFDISREVLQKRVQHFVSPIFSSPLKDFLLDFYCLTVIDEEHQDELDITTYAGAVSFDVGMGTPIRHVYEHVVAQMSLAAAATDTGPVLTMVYDWF